MRFFVFRNNTIEMLFNDKDISYSGYDDISVIPDEANTYIWFYQVPFNVDCYQLSNEVNTYFDRFKMVYERIDKTKTFIVFSLENLFTLKFANNNFELENAINSFNSNIFQFAKEHSNIKVLDLSEFTKSYLAEQLVDWKFYFMSQMQFNPKLSKDFSAWFSRKIEEIELKRKKCLVLDLDNTLWGGVLGEDGIEGIKLGGDYPGKAFLYWQKALLELSKYGIILTICSKNNEQDVLDAWEKNPFMVLKKEHFSAWQINWKDKASNIQELAKELNIGLDSMVFVDDNPSERELVKQMLPMVEVPDFPRRPYELMTFFKDIVNSYFRIYSITSEDKAKTEQYKANAQRAAEQKKFIDFDEYLRSLEIEISITAADEFNIPRIAQMTQKTNQFNLTTKRYTEQDISGFINNGWMIYCISVKDRFGDNGITGTIFLSPTNDEEFEIDNLLLSCRILGKGIENAFLCSIINNLYDSGVKVLKAKYISTLKNHQVCDFYDNNGFEIINSNDDIKEYFLRLNQHKEIKNLYKINFQ